MLSFQKFLASVPVSWLMARILHHADSFMLRLSGGQRTLTELAGLPVIELTTIGARSRQPRTLPIAGLPDGEKYVLIASNLGQARNPGWYYNLKANPECIVKKNGFVGTYVAREAEKCEYTPYFDMAVSYYIGFAAYKRRAGKRKIPVMILEPRR